jgi:hypothetical protein
MTSQGPPAPHRRSGDKPQQPAAECRRSTCDEVPWVGQQPTKTHCPGASLLTYVASIPLSTRSLTRLSELIRVRRTALGGRWRRLPAHEQALMTLAHLRNGDTLAVWRSASPSPSRPCGGIYARRSTCSPRMRPTWPTPHGGPGNWHTRSSTARSSRSTESPTKAVLLRQAQTTRRERAGPSRPRRTPRSAPSANAPSPSSRPGRS